MPLLHKEYSKRAKYTKEYLETFCKEKNIVLTGEYNCKIDRDTIITGICNNINCNEIYERKFRSLVDNQCYYCKKCLNIISNQKRQQTCNERYGVSFVTQVQEIQEKTMNTNMKKYNVKRPAQATEIKNKTEETNVTKYGVKCSLQNKEIRKKADITQLKNRGISHFNYRIEALCKLCEEHNILILEVDLSNDFIDLNKRPYGTQYPIECFYHLYA